MTARRIVLDSNVIISAFLFGGRPAQILGLVLDGEVQCFASLPILDEVRDVLRRPKFALSPDQALCLVEELHDMCQLVSPTIRVRVVHDGPHDNMVLECALAASAQTVVSGDSHLLALAEWRGIRILSPTDFMEDLKGQP